MAEVVWKRAWQEVLERGRARRSRWRRALEVRRVWQRGVRDRPERPQALKSRIACIVFRTPNNWITRLKL